VMALTVAGSGGGRGGSGLNLSMAISSLVFYGGFGALYGWLIGALRRGVPAAWNVQAVVSVLGLLAFPLGTLLHLLILLKCRTYAKG